MSNFILPTEYQGLEWIETNGSQYIAFTESEPLKFKAGDVLGFTTSVNTSNTSSQTGFCGLGYYWTWIGYDRYYSSYLWQDSNYFTAITDDCNGTADKKNRYELQINTNYNFSYLNLGLYQENRYLCNCRIFSCEKFRQSGTDKYYDFYLVPCYRIADDVTGYYELVNGTFHPLKTNSTNPSGTGVQIVTRGPIKGADHNQGIDYTNFYGKGIVTMSKLNNLAEAIQQKTGDYNPMTIDQMTTAIRNLNVSQ